MTGKVEMKRFFRTTCAALALGSAILLPSAEAQAQEIQLTGPLAGAPAVRKLRLHREGRFEFAPGVSFSLLDEYLRTIMPGARLTYHPTDWLGLGAWGGYGFQYTTGLTDELQEKGIDNRNCTANPSTTACRLTAVNLTRGDLSDDQLGHLKWTIAPQITFIPFRGKLALFSSLFVDTDISLFLGPAIVGVEERKPCGFDEDGNPLDTACADPSSYELESRVTVAPTFGLGFNFYPSDFIGFGAEWRGLPYSWNTSGFDNFGGGTDGEFPDNSVNGDDRAFKFNSMLTVNVSIQLPTTLESSE
jgi:hypothetical protein